MKANELRIGNLISERNGHIVEVVSINSDNTIRVKGGDCIEVGCFRPNIFNGIPLTEELLEKFGFSRVIRIQNGIVYGIDGIIAVSFNVYGFGWQLENCEYPAKIEYVHQLQNLYFALTGEELEIK